MQEGKDKLFEQGYYGESFAEWWAINNGYSYKRALSEEERLEKGIDCYINGIATDVKNTNSIFLLNFDMTVNRFKVRHPFREKSAITNYLMLDISQDRTKHEIKYFGNTVDYLVENFFKDVKAYNDAVLYIQQYNDKSLAAFKHIYASECLKALKYDFVKFLKPNIWCSYDEHKAQHQYTLSLIPYRK